MSGRKKSIQSKQLTSAEELHLHIFAAHRHFYDFFTKTGELVNFSHEIQNDLLNAYKELHDPYYHYVRTCPVCVVDFLNTIYRWYDNRK